MMDLLDLAQMENNTFKLNKVFFSLPDAIKQACEIVSHQARTKNLQLLGPMMQQSEEQYFDQIYGDRNRLVQVVTNFLSNSVKFSNKNSKIIVKICILQKQVLQN